MVKKVRCKGQLFEKSNMVRIILEYLAQQLEFFSSRCTYTIMSMNNVGGSVLEVEGLSCERMKMMMIE